MAAVVLRPWMPRELDNLTELAELTEDSLLSSVKKRYDEGLVYTDVGDILVSLNPFREVPIYSAECSGMYAVPDVSHLAPHIFRSASRAFMAMLDCRKDQVFVISGESGAGKTEAAKLLMRQIMAVCKSGNLGQHLQEKIVQTSPLLEAFGNARTVLNKNSSRFGKFLQLIFTEDGRIAGAGFEEYLVEKSRVSSQAEDERNFHIFYYLFAGLPRDVKKSLQLESPQHHKYLSSYDNVREDCSSEESRVRFEEVLESLKCIGFLDTEYKELFTILAVILHIGDIEFVPDSEDTEHASVCNPEKVEIVCRLLGLEHPEDIAFALTTLRNFTRGEAIDKHYTCEKAAEVRDAIAKAIYQRMFCWIIHHINMVLEPPEHDFFLHIGILDIFGFEIFNHNGFEQCCINLANEQLQHYFNHQIFAMEKAEYAKEGLDGLAIRYRDNKHVLDLFLTRPLGLLSLLEEQSRSPKGSDKGFVQKCKQSIKNDAFVPHKGDLPTFAISHYAAKVTYEAAGFLERNNDSLPLTVVSILQHSTNQLVYTFFNRPEAINATLRRKPHLKRSQLQTLRKLSTNRKSTLRRRKSQIKRSKGNQKSAGAPNSNRSTQTVTTYFRESLELLTERLLAAAPHFVRCIKPNMLQKPNKFENEFVLKQMRYTGMVEAVRVRREGYAFRPYFSDFTYEFRGIAYKYTDEVHPSEVSCRYILEKAGMKGWLIGKSRVFLRYYHEEQLHALLRDLHTRATRIQSIWKGFRARKLFGGALKEAKAHRKQLEEFMATIAIQSSDIPERLIALDHIDVRLKDKRFPKKMEEQPPKEPRLQYTGLEYHNYGVGNHHWPGEENPANKPPKPWMVPTMFLPAASTSAGYYKETESQSEYGHISTAANDVGNEAMNGLQGNEVPNEELQSPESPPLLPRATIVTDSQTVNKKPKQERKSSPLKEDSGGGLKESKVSKLSKIFGNKQTEKPKRAKKKKCLSETDSGHVGSPPTFQPPTPPSAPPMSTSPDTASLNSIELVQEALSKPHSSAPLGFYKDLSIEAAKIVLTERDGGSYLILPNEFRSPFGEEYTLMVSDEAGPKAYHLARYRDSTLFVVPLNGKVPSNSKAETKKFFTLDVLILYYRNNPLPDGVLMGDPIIIMGRHVAGLTASGPTEKKQVLPKGKAKMLYKRKKSEKVLRKDWEI